MSAPSAPLRAITNSLSLRATPSIPPPSQVYEPLVRAVLRHRLLFRIFTFSVLFTWFSVVADLLGVHGKDRRLGLAGTLLSPVRPTTLAFVCVTWALGVLPVIVMKKVYMSATPTIASSPAKVFQTAASKKSTLHSLLAYISAASIFTFLHVFIAYTYEPSLGNDPALTVLSKSRQHPYNLNGRYLYIFFSQITLALLFLSRSVMLDRFSVRWTASLLGSEVETIRLARFATGIVTTALLALLSVMAHTLLFGLGRAIVLPLIYRLPIIPHLLRPFTAHFLQGPFSLTLLWTNWPLIRRAYLLALLTTANWEFAEDVFDHYVAEPIAITSVTASPALTLASGISIESPYLKHFAFYELRHLATDPTPLGSSRRTALFADQKYNPTLWASLARSTLITLGNDYQLFLRRGAPAPPPAVEKKEVQKEAPKVPHTPLVKTNVLRQPQAASSPLKSALNTLAAPDGPIASAVGSTHLPELFRSVIQQDYPSALRPSGGAADAKKSGDDKQQGFVARLKEKGKARLRAEIVRRIPTWMLSLQARANNWWTRERLNRVVEGSLPNRKLDALAIEAICAFVCASLDEDRYGVVQRDIPRILEALVSFLTAIEEYQTEINTKYPPLPPAEVQKLSPKEFIEMERQREEVRKAGETLSEVGDALKNGLVHVAQTFGNKLTAFKFPPRIAKKLQGFVDYT